MVVKKIHSIYTNFIRTPLLFKLSIFFIVSLAYKIIMDNKVVNYKIIEKFTTAENRDKITKIEDEILELKDFMKGNIKKGMVCESTTGINDDILSKNIDVSDSKPADMNKYYTYLYVFAGIVGVGVIGIGGYYIANMVFNKIEGEE